MKRRNNNGRLRAAKTEPLSNWARDFEIWDREQKEYRKEMGIDENGIG